MLNIASIMQELACRQSVFHDERDFQLELAVLLREVTGTRIRIEAQFPIKEDPNARLDLWLPELRLGIELKYPVDTFKYAINKEVFDLIDSREQEAACFNYWNDITRLEFLIEKKTIEHGFAIILTNKSVMWRKPRRHGAKMDPIRLFDGRREVKGDITVFPERYSTSLVLAGTYDINWREFYDHKEERGLFKYVATRGIAFEDYLSGVCVFDSHSRLDIW